MLNSAGRRTPPDAIPSVGADRLLPFLLQAPLLCEFIFRTKGRGSRASMTTHRILILGGGLGGVYVARRLDQIFAHRDDVEITLLSGENCLLQAESGCWPR